MDIIHCNDGMARNLDLSINYYERCKFPSDTTYDNNYSNLSH